MVWLWQTQAAEMTAALARLDEVVGQAVAVHRGVRPVEQGEGDSFISPRTVQTHLTHVYAKLAITSRTQLAQEAARQP